MDFIQWSKDHDIPVRPWRGSGAGSLVAYVLLITDIGPVQYDLLFERFLNPERVSMPDFDIDFCMERREEVIAYVAENYGREAVSQIITFGTMAAKAVVRDVARAQGKAYAVGDRLSKAIPFEVGINLQKAYDMEEPLRDYIQHDEDAAEVWAMAKVLEGITRQTGKHAGGVVIAPTKLTDFSATSCDDDFTGLVTLLDKSDVEEAGLVKFDFLGLKTLTVIDWAKKTIDKIRAKTGEEPLVIEDIPLDDKTAFAYLKEAKTTAVFQLESRGIKDLGTRLQPDNLEEMIALVALFRPGPLESGMVDDFINRKHGRSEVAYPHPDFQHESLKEVLEPTYGVIVYQEQVMQIAQVLAGYTLGGADMLRRAMGKKKPEEMAKQRETFREGAISVNVDPDLAMKIFDLVEKFAGYGFNKSHSAAYAVVSYHTLWLKTHYPAPFMAAVLTADMQNTDKIVIFVEECRDMGIDLVLPDINQGDFGFTVNDEGQVVYGLGAIKGVGEGPIEAILEAREDGPFSDLFDFCARVDRKKINKRSLDALIRCGAFDKIGPNRAVMFAALPDAVKSAEQTSNSAAAGMWDMFGEMESEVDEDPYKEYRRCRDLTLKERLNGERDTLGLYVTGHPFDEYEKEVRSFVRKRLVDVQPSKGAQSLAGLVVDLRMMKNKRGDNMAFVTLDDRSGRMEVAIFSDVFESVRDYLIKDIVLVAEAEVNFDEYSGTVKARCKSLRDITSARMSHSSGVCISMNHAELDKNFHKVLHQQLAPFDPNGLSVNIAYQGKTASGVVKLGAEFNVVPNDDLMMRLKRCYGEENVEMQYHG
jgi:DNA polymerase-3 subunit alpha